MSVINSVLKDLDSKPSAFTPLEFDTVTSLDRNGRNIKWYWWLIPVMLLLLVFTFWFSDYGLAKQNQVVKQMKALPGTQQQSINNQQPAAALAELPVINQQVKSVDKLERNQLTGLQIQENEEFMQLEFQLTKFAPSFLKQRSNNRYVFMIKRVANAIVTPQISDSPWLRKIKISTLGEDVEIRFDTQSGVLVDTQERREGAAYYWLIKLKKTREVVTIPSVKESEVVAPVNSTIHTMPVESPGQLKHTEKEIVKKENQSEAAVKLQIRPLQNKYSDQMKFNSAIRAAKSGDIKIARKELEQLLGGKFDHSVRVQLLGILSRQNDTQAFTGLLSSSLQKYPQDKVLLLYEANRLFAEKQYLTLIEKFKTQTGSEQLLSLLATSYQRTEQHQLAAEHFILALKMNPQQPRLWISLGISQQYLAQREQALNSYQMALRSGSMSPRLYDFVHSKIKQLSN
jgi:hypothetical protein